MRILGITLADKHLRIALRGIFGIGPTRAEAICKKVGIDPTTKVSAIPETMVAVIQNAVNDYEVEGDLKRQIATNIKRLKDIKCYRGRRHIKNLPVRGQNTRSNARTRKGKRKQGIKKKDRAKEA